MKMGIKKSLSSHLIKLFATAVAKMAFCAVGANLLISTTFYANNKPKQKSLTVLPQQGSILFPHMKS
jgi:hypothetical protein